MWSISDELCAKENELENVPRSETGDIFPYRSTCALKPFLRVTLKQCARH